MGCCHPVSCLNQACQTGPELDCLFPLACLGRALQYLASDMNSTPLRIAVTGAAGQIGYSLLFRIASGSMFGLNQPVILHLIEIEPALPALQGVVMELDDCA